jgi:S1-C subfamily serine protease
MEPVPETTQAPSNAPKPNNDPPAAEEIPFLWIHEVSPGSPGEEAGLKIGDGVVKFDTVDFRTDNGLKQIAQIVQTMVNHPLALKVLREDGSHDLELTPHTWSGNGVLGVFLSKNK